ncbi:DNA polymerase III subunit alpha [Gemmatimonas groenlandica]|uniref:Error-prone DNA polymerase n=1 Tax=Gemmatimonas groenlandica TaxID=2732249 RepID=A0A6M4IGW6_9BACT|nr:PHP domain-containing protein [Gemmatimonas groenlandica]QJR34083.1 PHP domain-containing protein [Gemmatimonas groenlandica]
MPNQYVELHCHSALSLLDGASLPESLAERAAELGYPALAITDHDEMGGVVRFGTACETLGIGGILGVELTVRMPDIGNPGAERRTHMVLLAETRDGYRNIASLVTRARMDSDRGTPSVPWALVTRHVEGVMALTGCPRGWVPQLLAEGRTDDAYTAAGELRDVFGEHLAVECWDHRLPEERALVQQLRPLAAKLGVPWVVTNDVHYATPEQRIVHDVLNTLRHERTLDTMGTRLRPNAEWALKKPSLIYQRWRGAEEGVKATLAIAERCAFRLEQLKPSMPAFPLPPGISAQEYLTRLVEQGAYERWNTSRTPKHDTQLAHELAMIGKLDLAGFFLTVWDIVRFARREGILCQGRGSAANSAVCYCLGITAVDPIRMELLFERFLSEGRKEPPDIDIDFAHRDRERVLQYVYNRYGREHAAMVCEQITWRGRSAVRDAARVLGFSVQQGDMLASLSDRFSARSTADALRVDTPSPEGEAAVPPAAPGTTDADRLGQQMIGGTEATTKARVVREASRKVASTQTKSQTKSSAQRAPKGPTDRDGTWAQVIDMQAERKIAADARAQLGPLAKGSDNSRPSETESHEERRNRTTATRDTASGREVLERAGLDPNDERVRRLADVVAGLHQLPRHRSIHVGGFILTEEPLGSIVPIEPASMPGRTVIQWEKDDLDPVGLVKIDLLGLGMLTVVQDCLLYIRHTRGTTIDLGQLDMSDQAVYDVMCRADTVGLFQIESRAQMNTLPRLKPRCFYDLVVEVALIRPGPIQGEMVHPYLRRRAGLEPVTYPHPMLEKVLKRTLGVPLFQEQGMQVAIVAAGFTPTQADQLRRAMGHKRSRERMAQICEELIAGMAKNGIPEETGRRIYNQINAFADYGFPESHAASFALIVYATAWLRHYYAPEYTAAILNAQPMGFYAPGTLIEDAKRHGVEVRPVDLTRSTWDHALEMADGRVLVPNDGVVRWGRQIDPQPMRDVVAVRLGVRLVRGLGAKARRALEAALVHGPFTSVEDAVRRVSLDKTSWRRLAEAGAFDSMFAHEPAERRRRVALWEVMASTRGPELPLAPFEAQPVPTQLPAYTPIELTEADYRMTGLSLAGHPMKHVRPILAPNGVLSAREAHEQGKDGQRVAVAGLVICRQRPGTAKGFVFLTLEDETGMINIVITPDRFEEHALLISRSPMLLIRGTLQVEQHVVNVRAKQFKALELGGGEQHVKGHNYR